ncbi:MAG: DsbA family protein, partial [Firmicutes bacterium]|nr:DsbA family protein [Bacillota bacterium]
GRLELMSNSRLALEATEFARDKGGFDDLHNLFFKAYFQEGKDLGSMETVLEVSGKAGLDTVALREALAKGVYRGRLQEARERGMKYQVTGLPTFIFNGEKKIVGAQQYDVFVNAVKQYL